MYQTRTTTPV